MRWLEEYLAVSVGGLKNKTKVKDYWKAEGGRMGGLAECSCTKQEGDPVGKGH